MGINLKAMVLKNVVAHFIEIIALDVKQLAALIALKVEMLLAMLVTYVLVTAAFSIIRHKTAHKTPLHKAVKPAVNGSFAELFTRNCKLCFNFGGGKMP
jgi:hypothetical protein